MSYYEYSYALDELTSSMGASLLLNIPTFVMGIATYVLTALSLYTIAKRRGLSHAWLSWLPVADMWILGSISDQYRYVARGQIKSKRKILIWLSVISAVLSVAAITALVTFVVKALMIAFNGGSEDEILNMILGPLMGTMGLSLPLMGVGIAVLVFRYMALYDLYLSCDPSNAVLFLVLSILIGVTEPFFLIAIRNKDEGMPPRRQEIPQAYQPPQNEEHYL